MVDVRPPSSQFPGGGHLQPDPFCLSPANAAQLLADAPWRRFAVIGDSLSAGTGDPSPGYATLPWADRVADVLRRVHPDLAYLNTGVIGATAVQTLATQLDRAVQFLPDLIHISYGANDIARPDPDYAEIEQTMRRVFDLAAETGAQLMTFTLARVFDLPKIQGFQDRVRTVNEITRSLAADYNAVVVEMWDHPITARPNLLSADHIHFTMSGHAVMASEVARGLVRLLDTTCTTTRCRRCKARAAAPLAPDATKCMEPLGGPRRAGSSTLVPHRRSRLLVHPRRRPRGPRRVRS